jgi:hypothetical protein
MVTTTQVIHKVLVDIVHKATGVTMEQKNLNASSSGDKP